ncbi:MAG: UDP-galactopyranose mutase [Eggerthellaceae bacterium]|jgi:UDP-galactopyranose mutase
MAVNYVNFSDIDIDAYDAVVVGCGFAGSVVARELAERKGSRVVIIEKRGQIGGNMYDEYDDAGILVHRFGPHIFHTNDKRAFDYVRRFTEWRPYQHEVLSNWFGTYIPVPFNKNSMEIVWGKEKAAKRIQKLIDTFGDEKKVTITELRAQKDPELSEIADFVYENVFLYYTQKQWGLTPDEVDPSVVARVPVFISRDNRYFQDAYQGMPAHGYTVLFENMLSHPNIDVALNVEAESVFGLEFADDSADAQLSAISIKGKPFTGPIVYTGPLDELFLARFGRLPYRSLDFVYETYDQEHYQPCGTVNYTVTEDFTRITEFKYLTGQQADCTTIMKEYSHSYDDPRTQIPYYAIINQENAAHYERYRNLTAGLPNFYPIGRLAEYRYYNMDVIIGRALQLADTLCE